ncbi:hypothetical protein SOASR030_07540 [Leminorella grimontii]|uniref:Uncharacterized protein n=1 Tax=Leminorella grimontii TaxID=82981 RepID=A0AAV5N1T8_9GAMM|nr:hypothetical protein SOASR030_07540 [Leminorella grimontii]
MGRGLANGWRALSQRDESGTWLFLIDGAKAVETKKADRFIISTGRENNQRTQLAVSFSYTAALHYGDSGSQNKRNYC